MSETSVSGANVRVGGEPDSEGKAADSGHHQRHRAGQFCPYRVVSVKKERGDDSWYEYVVGNGESTITGHRLGPQEEVEEHADRFVAGINARGTRGRKSVPSSWRGRPKPKSTGIDDD